MVYPYLTLYLSDQASKNGLNQGSKDTQFIAQPRDTYVCAITLKYGLAGVGVISIRV